MQALSDHKIEDFQPQHWEDMYLDVHLEVWTLLEVIFEDSYLPFKMYWVTLQKWDTLVIDKVLWGNEKPDNPKIRYSIKRNGVVIVGDIEDDKKNFSYFYLRKIWNFSKRPDFS